MNLLSKLHKNSILTGPIENYCLVCGCLLQSEEESYAHINEPSHVQKLSSVPKLAKYNDCIIKIKEGYFCRFCNIILPTIKRVGFHVIGSKHSENKTSLFITRHAGLILAFNTVIINERSWNGLDGSTCSVCNEDYDDEEDHKKGSTHVLNLIQSKCEFGETYVYRKVDEELFFCLICNAILPVLEKQTHSQSEKHLDFYEKSKVEETSIRNKQVPAIETNNNITPSPIQPNKNSVKTPTSIAKDNQIVDSEKVNDSKSKPKDTKTQNGSALDINDYRTTSPKNTESAKLNTEKDSVFNSQTSQKTRSQSNDTQNTQNLSNILTGSQEIIVSQNTNIPIQSLKPEKETAKVNTANEQISKESHTQELQDKSKPIVCKDAGTKNSETPKVKVELDKISKAKANNEVSTAKIHLYEFLEARDFLIKSHNEQPSHCALCDTTVQKADFDVHGHSEHHRILYSKHVARKTKLSKSLDNVNKRDVTHTSDSNGKLKSTINKENVAPSSGQNKNDASEANGKLVEPKGKVETKESNDAAKTTAPAKLISVAIPPRYLKEEGKVSDSVTKENTKTVIEQPSEKDKNDQISRPECKQPVKNIHNNIIRTENEHNRSNESDMGETKQAPTDTTAQNKKAAKKIQKKAAKATISETDTVLPKQIQETETALSEVSGQRTSETGADKADYLKECTSELLIGGSANLEANYTIEELNKRQDCVEHTTEKIAAIMAPRFTSDAEIKTENLVGFLKTVSHIERAFDVVINCTHVLGNLSFVLILRTGDRAECVVCGEKFALDDITVHLTTDGHMENVLDCFVVTSVGLDDEFIRQVKTKEYHCGYCNVLIPSWDDIERHLASYSHEDAKTSAAWRLQRYLSLIPHAETREVRSILATTFRCTSE